MRVHRKSTQRLGNPELHGRQSGGFCFDAQHKDNIMAIKETTNFFFRLYIFDVQAKGSRRLRNAYANGLPDQRMANHPRLRGRLTPMGALQSTIATASLLQ